MRALVTLDKLGLHDERRDIVDGVAAFGANLKLRLLIFPAKTWIISIYVNDGTHRATSAPAPAAVLPATGAAPGRAEPANGRLVSPSAAHVGRANYRESGESPLPEANARGSAEKEVKIKLRDALVPQI